ncbi:MAG: hypothetical protein NFW16_20190 [Candidatus Accumulibacter sp.]|uniref:hypothetical protein n=1 Tax=Accumulibacter sp. TaxID=2053492 RepID=UPI0025890669|nr:hypothetical protein [Accumulibacter sp.]MCM8623987.1 hypothetical protein [Accumulibacter sp.]
MKKMLKCKSMEVVRVAARELTAEQLRAVMDHEILAIRLVGLVPPCDLSPMATFVREHPPQEFYQVEPNFTLMGGARFQGTEGPEAISKYFENALNVMRAVADGIAPATPPWERLLALFNEVWPSGATFMRFGGKLGQVGLIRVVKSGGRVGAHQDMAHWDDPTDIDIAAFSGVLSMVLYLEMPPTGGGLGLHGIGFVDSEDYHNHLIAGSAYEVDVNALNSAPLWIRPEPGEALIFSPDLLHEVQHVPDGIRSTVSVFAVRRGERDPISLFS